MGALLVAGVLSPACSSTGNDALPAAGDSGSPQVPPADAAADRASGFGDGAPPDRPGVDSMAGMDAPADRLPGATGDGAVPGDECTGGAGPSATPSPLAGCSTEGQLGFVRDGNIPYVCARGPLSAQKPACLLWRRGTWYLQTRGLVWDRSQGDLGTPCTTAGQRSGFPGGTFVCAQEPGTQKLTWALFAGEQLSPYVRRDPTETFLPTACTPPADTSNGAQFYRSGISIDPTDSNTLYLNIEWIGPFRSRDGGATWTPFNITGRSLPARKTNGAACHGEYPGFAFDTNRPQDLYFIAGGAPGVQGTNPAFQGGGIWKSIDGGASFHWLGLPEMNQYVASFAQVNHGSTLLWGATSSLGTMTGAKAPTPHTTGLMYRSDDGGGTWRELATGLWPESTVSLIWVDPAKADHYIVGIFQYVQRLAPSQARAPGLIESLDGGATWKALPGLPAGPRPVTAANTVISRDGKIIFSCGISDGTSGLACYRSEDGGITFGPASPALQEVAADPLDATGQRYIAYRLAGGTPTIPVPAAILRSLDAGKTWSVLSEIPTQHPEHFVWDPRTQDRVYLTGDAGQVHRSNDGGAHWQRLTVYTDFLTVARTD